MLKMISHVDSKNAIPLVFKEKWGWSCKEYGADIWKTGSSDGKNNNAEKHIKNFQ